jgi:hypothetical protein
LHSQWALSWNVCGGGYFIIYFINALSTISKPIIHTQISRGGAMWNTFLGILTISWTSNFYSTRVHRPAHAILNFHRLSNEFLLGPTRIPYAHVAHFLQSNRTLSTEYNYDIVQLYEVESDLNLSEVTAKALFTKPFELDFKIHCMQVFISVTIH